MKRCGLILIALCTAVSFAQIQSETVAPTDINPPRGGGVLYDQTTNPGGNGFPAQNFEAAFDVYDCMGADDFVVPDGVSWDVQSFYFVSTLSTGGPVTSVDVNIHADDAGSPGAVLHSFPGIAASHDGTGVNAVIPTTNLETGTYWVAFSANMDFGCCGQIFWSNRTAPTGGDSHFINPGNGFGSGCTDWTPTPICGVGGGLSDALFSVSGEEITCDITSIVLIDDNTVQVTGVCDDFCISVEDSNGVITQLGCGNSVDGTVLIDVPFFADSIYFVHQDGTPSVVLASTARTVPTLQTWALIAFCGLLMVAGVMMLSRKKRTA